MSLDGIRGFLEIKELSAETQKKLFAKPQHSAGVIEAVASQVLARIPEQPEECSNIVQFLHAVIHLNSEYQLHFQQNPFQKIIGKLQATLVHLQPTAQLLEKKFRCQLNALDLGSRTLKKEIHELLEILDKLQQSNGITKSQKLQLAEALQSIVAAGYYKEKSFEINVAEYICKLSPEFKNARASIEPRLKSTELDGRRRMLHFLQQECRTLHELAHTAPKQMNAIKKTLIHQRLDLIISRIPDNARFQQNFTSNFVNLVRAIKNFELNLAHPIFIGCWSELLRVYDPEENKRFTQMLNNYPDLCPDFFIPELVEIAKISFLKQFTLDELCTFEGEAFVHKITAMIEKAQTQLPLFFTNKYERHLMHPHLWISCHLSAIIQPYSQAADVHRNQFSGTCLQNSLERHALLLKDPRLDGLLIPMGSSSQGRAAHATVAHVAGSVKKGALSSSELYQLQIESSKRVGLERSSNSKSCSTPEGVVRLIDGSQKAALWILVLTSPDEGHAFNIQITQEAGLFRFIDDNMGVCGWSDFDQFCLHFLSYLKAFYPTYTKFSLESYKKS